MSFREDISKAENHLAQRDKKIADLINKYQPCTIQPHEDYYTELVSSIVSQQLSVKAAATILERLKAKFDGQVPTPKQLIDKDTEELRQCGISYQKIGYMKDLAAHILDGRLDLEHLASQKNIEIQRELTGVKGIGVWSAHMFMIFSLGRLDVLPVGDLGIRKAIMNIYGLEILPSAEQINQISEKNNWAPYESVASWYLWRSLDNK